MRNPDRKGAIFFYAINVRAVASNLHAFYDRAAVPKSFYELTLADKRT